jgi:pseudouridine-5'-phosphate glycosidase
LTGEAVERAVAEGRPLVALESTLITHGMPYPANLETARAAEDAVREAGAEPATIAVLEGRVRIGLDDAALSRLARAAGTARKCSLRDLPIAVAAGEDGGTTVAATLHLAHRAGIRVFATGGIGGVHRGAETSLDISADLAQLAVSPLAVVCAGPKAILDLALTREHLETHGVPVLGYGTDEMPAFWSRESGHPVDQRVDSPGQAAAVLEAQRALGLGASVLVCNPLSEEHALPRSVVEGPIESALGKAAREGITGRDLTPFLLAEVLTATGGESLAANRALITSNAALAARIAVALPTE